MSYREFTPNPTFSIPLNDLLFKFIERLDMSTRDREILEDLALFAYNEGKIDGKVEYLNEVTETKLSDNAETENAN